MKPEEQEELAQRQLAAHRALAESAKPLGCLMNGCAWVILGPIIVVGGIILLLLLFGLITSFFH